MFQLLVGHLPFQGANEGEIFDSILEDEPEYPDNLSPQAVSFLQQVCVSHHIAHFLHI